MRCIIRRGLAPCEYSVEKWRSYIIPMKLFVVSCVPIGQGDGSDEQYCFICYEVDIIIGLVEVVVGKCHFQRCVCS
jgi:hypothetical protein